MDETPTALLLGGVIFLILLAVGVFVATLMYLQRAQSEKQRQNARPGRPQVSAAGKGRPPVSDRIGRAATPTEADKHATQASSPGEIMRVIRDERTGRVLVEVGGQRYAHIKEIKDAQVGRRVLWAIADLIRFTGGMVASPQAMRAARVEARSPGGGRAVPRTTPARARSAVQPTPPAVKEPSPVPPSNKEELPPRPPASAPSAVTPETTAFSSQPKARYNIVEFFRRGFQPREPVEPLPAPTSFVDEIEEILQRRIAERTTPLSRSVHVRTGPEGLLQIVVGVEVYDSADDIPYPEIKSLIKAAVAEWERR